MSRDRLQWSVMGSQNGGGILNVTKAAASGVVHVCRGVHLVSINTGSTQAYQWTVYDGTTPILEGYIGGSNNSPVVDRDIRSDLYLPGTIGNAMTLSINVSAGSGFSLIANLVGYDI